MLVALKYFSVWRTFERALMQLTKKIGEPNGLADFFVAASLRFGRVGQNFVKAKHAGRIRL